MVSEPSSNYLRSLLRPRSIRGKLIRLLLLSLAVDLALLSFIGFATAREVSNYRIAEATSTSVELEMGVQHLIHRLQRERGVSTGLLGGNERFRAELPAYREQTDTAKRALEDLLAKSALPVVPAIRKALEQISDLPATRSAVDSELLSVDAAHKYFTDRIGTLNQGYVEFDEANDRVMTHGLLALRALSNAKESTGQERALLNGVFGVNHFAGDQYVRFTEIRANKLAGLIDYNRQATSEERARLAQALSTDQASRVAADERIAIGGDTGTLPQRVDSLEFHTLITAYIDDLQGVLESVGQDIRNQATALQSNAIYQLLGLLVLALVAIATQVILIADCSRSIINPLAGLVEEADDVATKRLPDAIAKLQSTDSEELPVPIAMRTGANASTEIRTVTEALDRMQTSAFTLAADQALVRRNMSESLASLGRRNQNLVRRQLSYISEFEREELDPAMLAKLFELDHLATRMRRNAESLLVLVGDSSPRRWASPLPITDVIRAALSEVEDYRRVVLRRVDEAFVTGAVVTEVAHLLAELVENSLSFSPPDLEVEIYGRRTGAGYLLAIIDHGVGMTEEALANANARLNGTGSFLVTPTRFLGHYVVGCLAERLSAKVQLAESPATGVTAKVLLPTDLLGDPPKRGTPTKSQSPSALPAQSQRSADLSSESTPEADEVLTTVATASTGTQHRTGALSESAKHRESLAGDLDLESMSPTGEERTRNGLLKRARRQRIPDVPRHASPSHTRSGPTTGSRSPSDIQNMLTSFRAGHQRGERSSLETETAKRGLEEGKS